MYKPIVSNGTNDKVYVDVIQDDGSVDFVKDGKLFKNYPGKSVMVADSSDLDYLTSYTPGTIAYTAGYAHIWQKSTTNEWVSIV